MKTAINRISRICIGIIACFLSPLSNAWNMSFPDSPYCFDKLVVRGNPAHTTLDYVLVIPNEEDQQKVGDIFVGFRRKSNPDTLWLQGFFDSWSLYDSSKDPVAVLSTSSLPPVLQLNIINIPVDLTAFLGDGEVLVGYGRRTNTSSGIKDSFDDMVASKHYSVVWVVSSQRAGSERLCLNATGIMSLTAEALVFPHVSFP